jgi:glutamate-1-semialdehyde 2,1-aminomutase
MHDDPPFPGRSGLNWARAQALLQQERACFIARNPRSQALARRAAQHRLFGVPLHWMNDWGTPFALQAVQAQGAHLVDADGHTLADFCLGDTGAMFGHSPAPVALAVAHQAARGITAMLASEDAAVVGEMLSARFGLPFWQFAMTASDANRFVLRWLRAASGRRKLIVFNGCYHGTVDDVFVDLEGGRPTQRNSLLGQVHDLTDHTVVVEFNDLAALEAALVLGDVACVLAEPAMTNIGMVLPEPGYWQAAQAWCWTKPTPSAAVPVAMHVPMACSPTPWCSASPWAAACLARCMASAPSGPSASCGPNTVRRPVTPESAPR